MEREIEFRGRRTDNKEWIYGSLIIRKLDGIKQYYIYDNSIDELEISEYCNSADCMNPRDLKDLFIKVIPESIGQYTGLKDKNGKEIYEGDIMLYSIIHSSTDKKRIGEKQYAYIKWLDKEAKFVQAFNNSDDYEMLDETMKLTEIIGNIFENPELLK